MGKAYVWDGRGGRLDVLLEGGRAQAEGDKTLEPAGWGMVREFLQKESWLPGNG